MDPGAALAELLVAQQGMLLRSQALASGLTDRAIAWRLARGLWRRIYPGLYATFTGPPTPEQRTVGASLLAGKGAQITGVAALRRHGVRYLPSDDRVHVLVPLATRRVSRGFVVIVRTSRPDEHALHRAPLEICSLPRAAADAARAGYSRRDVRAFLAELLQERRVTVDQLDAEWRQGPVRNSKLLGEVLSEVRDGALSAPEAELRALASTSTVLPPILWNPTLRADDGTRLPSPDGWIQDVGLALEMDSDEFHSSVDDQQRTRERAQLLATYGILTLSFSPREIRKAPRRVLATIEGTYRERPRGFTRARGVPRLSSLAPPVRAGTGTPTSGRAPR
ncbi:type IV toxin-antitoxin system AbiEi family antitoxin domain-containing protein [Cryptosporangium sp. NPDC048952]|uniref:type IV toxin-antitoxin system AbiEi family antitoxin domain-containing protein n=1 Tax=Cryptosporangium sp. NPDC048952 TaxID=3363961 RepID=UPI003720333D